MILTKEEIAKIPREERYELLQDLWESLQSETGEELTDEQQKILDERLQSAQKYPDSFVPWGEVKEKLIQYIRSES